MDWWINISEIVRNLGLLAAAIIGVWLGWKRVFAVNRQAEIARRDHVAELFNRAAGQLANEKLEIRLVGVYTLKQISDDFPDLTASVVKLLEAYLQDNPYDYGEEEPPIDRREIYGIIASKLGNKK